ncbi:MAG: B12-binding domain-containing radical SAM protein [Spirochaetales bacterium]
MNEIEFPLVLVSLQSPEDSEVLPLGAACAAASLVKAGLIEKKHVFLLSASIAYEPKLLLRRIAEKSPRVVGFSLYCWNSKVSIDLAARLRADFPDLLIIAGGPDAEWLALGGGQAKPFDAVFLGEAEVGLPAWFAETAARVFASGPRPRTAFIRARPAEAAALPSPWLEDILVPKRGASVAWELTRGCPFRCAYCYEGRGFSGLRHFERERLAAELELFTRSGVGKVFVLDPTFNVQRKRALSLLDLFMEKGGGILWNFEIRAELLDRAQAEAFAKIPCSLQIGLQSASPEVLEKIGRDLNRKNFASKTRLLNDTGAVFGLDLIYGLPGDSLSGFRRSLDFALSLMPNHLDIFPLAILPGTRLYEQREEFGFDCDSEPPYLLRSHPTFSVQDMGEAERLARACKVFYSDGRAVPWFLALLKAIRLAPSSFLGGFEASREGIGKGHHAIEALQLAYIARIYGEKNRLDLLPAAFDLIRYHGAWSRAFAEGAASTLRLSYSLQSLESPESLDLEYFCAHNEKRPCEIEVYPTPRGPKARILKRHA